MHAYSGNTKTLQISLVAIGIIVLSMISYADANSVFLSPLKQIKSRILAKDVKCNQGFQLVIKNEYSPACVKPNTATRLLTHGWLTLEKFEIIQQNVTGSQDQRQNTDQSTINYTEKSMISNQTYPSPLNVTYVINNLDSLYGKRITVYGYWYDKYPFAHPLPACRIIDPNVKPIYDNSTYVPEVFGGNNYLANTTNWKSGDVLVVRLPNNAYLESPVIDREKIVTVTGILEKYYQLNCLGDRYYKSAYLQVNPDQIIPAMHDNNTRYPTESVPVHNSGPVGTTNVKNLQPSPDCTYSNYYCSISVNSVKPLPPIPMTPTIFSNSNITKIIAIGMSPNPLKIGDIPRFTVTYQNISGKPIYGQQGCGSDLTYTISPDVNVEKIQVFGRQCAIFEDVIQPNQIITDGLDSSYYKIIQQGLLNVTLTLDLSDNGTNWSNSVDRIQFDVKATR